MVLTIEQENKQLKLRLKILEVDSQITQCKVLQLEYQLKMQELKLKREGLNQEYEQLLPSTQLQTPPFKSSLYIEEPSPTVSESFQQQAVNEQYLQVSPELSTLVQFNQSFDSYEDSETKPRQCDHCDITASEKWKEYNGKLYCRNCWSQYYYHFKTKGKESADKQFLEKICRDENGKMIKRKKVQ